jgi:hypothetical protein
MGRKVSKGKDRFLHITLPSPHGHDEVGGRCNCSPMPCQARRCERGRPAKKRRSKAPAGWDTGPWGGGPKEKKAKGGEIDKAADGAGAGVRRA